MACACLQNRTFRKKASSLLRGLIEISDSVGICREFCMYRKCLLKDEERVDGPVNAVMWPKIIWKLLKHWAIPARDSGDKLWQLILYNTFISTASQERPAVQWDCVHGLMYQEQPAVQWVCVHELMYHVPYIDVLIIGRHVSQLTKTSFVAIFQLSMWLSYHWSPTDVVG